MTKDRGLSPRSMRIVAGHAAIAGLCPLIPVPFVDDLVVRRVVRHMYEALYEAHDLTLPKSGARVLSAAPSHRLRAAAASVALFPVKKVVRKLVYVLAVKDCADVASGVFHDGWLLAHVLEDRRSKGARKASPESLAYLRRVREAMLATYKEVDPAPLKRALLGSFRGAEVGVRHGLQTLRRWAGGAEDAKPAPRVPGLASAVGAAANKEWRYMQKLQQTFRRHLSPSDSRADAADEARPANA